MSFHHLWSKLNTIIDLTPKANEHSLKVLDTNLQLKTNKPTNQCSFGNDSKAGTRTVFTDPHKCVIPERSTQKMNACQRDIENQHVGVSQWETVHKMLTGLEVIQKLYVSVRRESPSTTYQITKS